MRYSESEWYPKLFKNYVADITNPSLCHGNKALVLELALVSQIIFNFLFKKNHIFTIWEDDQKMENNGEGVSVTRHYVLQYS